MTKIALVFLVALAVAVSLTGCGKGNAVAEINGDKITYKDYVKEIGKSQVASKMLASLFERRLVLDLAKTKGVSPTDEQITRRLEFTKKSQDLNEFLKQQSMTMDDYKTQLKLQEASCNLAIQLMKDKVKQEDVDKAYDNAEWMYNGEDGRKVEAAVFRDMATAGKVEAELKKGSSLEKAQSTADPMAAMMGGRVQKLVLRKNDPRPQLADLIKVAFDTPVGKATAPVKLGGGMAGAEQFVILKIMSKMPPYKTDEKDAKILLKEDLALQKATGADKPGSNGGEMKKMIDEARKSAKIKIDEPALKDAEKEFRNPTPANTMPGGG